MADDDVINIRITQNGKVKNYINYALKRLTGYIDGELVIDNDENVIDTICFYGLGRASAKVITSAEVLKTLVPGLHQITELTSISSDERNKFMKLDTNQELILNDGKYELYEEDDNDDDNDDNDGNDGNDDIDNDNIDDVDNDNDINNKDNEQEEDPKLVISRHRPWKTVTVLRITLSKNQLDKNHIGYQSPNDDNIEFQELITNAKTSVFTDKNNIKKQIKKKKGSISPIAINIMETLKT